MRSTTKALDAGTTSAHARAHLPFLVAVETAHTILPLRAATDLLISITPAAAALESTDRAMTIERAAAAAAHSSAAPHTAATPTTSIALALARLKTLFDRAAANANARSDPAVALGLPPYMGKFAHVWEHRQARGALDADAANTANTANAGLDDPRK